MRLARPAQVLGASHIKRPHLRLHWCGAGSRDTTSIVWDVASAAPLATLQGHQYQVTSLGLLPSGDLVSGSLDK